MEMWEVLDKDGKSTGEIMKKNDQTFFDRGLCHLGAEVWIINSENKILIQKRSKQKRISPNMWAMTGGSVILGETSKDTIVREAKEELNIDIDANELHLITRFKIGSLWVDTYLLKHDYDIEKMKFQKDEVADAKWVTSKEIDNLVKEGNFMEFRWEIVGEFINKETTYLQTCRVN